MGYEPFQELAQTIYQREGPSGPNKVCCIWMLPVSGVKLSQQEYVYKLAESVRKLYPDVKDDYLFDLEVSDDTSRTSSCDCSDTDHVGRCESSRSPYIESRDVEYACSN